MADGLAAGTRAPDFVLPDADGTPSRFYGRVGGRPLALVFLGPGPAGSGSGAAAPAADLAAALGQEPGMAAAFIAHDARLLPGTSPGWVDEDGAVRARFGLAAAEGVAIVVLDANLRASGVATGAIDVAAIKRIVADDATGSADHVVADQAPVLMVPRVIGAADCAELIAQCRADAVETGVEKSGTGLQSGTVDHVLKRRRDVTVTDPQQLQHLSQSIGSRVMPEIERAFAFRATRFEGFKIAWYDEESGGFFAPHRDNLTPTTAHRVFGLSINLTDDYDGGELEFPEYGRQRYRAPAGGAMVFSSALLHAVHPVVRGARFVVLSFLYG